MQSQKDESFYIGSTADLKQRFKQHNLGRSKATKSGIPWELVYYEAFPSKALALERERELKRYGRGLVELKKRLGFR
ncbi:MAG: GIY-YIG nuclease family protein [Candidatus Saccharimonadales bacterium]